MRIGIGITLLAGAITLTGCVNQEDYETRPVQLQVSSGIITCQLYRLDRVLWDEAISAQTGMSIATADNFCAQEGVRVRDGGEIDYDTPRVVQ
ncbi:MAG: hypothetical protein AAF198_00025 [Pseudomonadota bacterium]